MSHFVPAETIIEFQPGGGWRWVGFDGCVKIAAMFSRMDHGGSMVTADLDVNALVPKLRGRQYAADGFDDVPGVTTHAQIDIDENTLSNRVVIQERSTPTTETTGRFSIVCTPSMKSGTPPVPDPRPLHQGTWSVRAVHEPRTTVEDQRDPTRDCRSVC